MKLISTRHSSPPVSLTQSMLQPLAPDGGMYLPAGLPRLPKAFLDNFRQMSMAQIGYVLLSSLSDNEFSNRQIKAVLDKAYAIDVPLVSLDGDTAVMELFHGPTLAFKDFGARLMAGLLDSSSRVSPSSPINILIATTGNTGSALAGALAGVKGVNVIIVFPRGTAGRSLESQFTTLGRNIYPLEIQGGIDTCHTLVATAFNDPELRDTLRLSTANSANPARLLGQMAYFFYGVSHMAAADPHDTPVDIALPAGNLGNLCALVMAVRMGLPAGRIIACENANDYLTRFMATGEVYPRPARPTLAYAADKSLPTNMERLLDLFGSDIDSMKACITACSYDDLAVINAVNECQSRAGYLCDPHTALAWRGMRDHRTPGHRALIVATAHPAKSLAAMTAITGRPVDMPLQLNRFMAGKDHRLRLKADYPAFRKTLMDINNNN